MGTVNCVVKILEGACATHWVLSSWGHKKLPSLADSVPNSCHWYIRYSKNYLFCLHHIFRCAILELTLDLRGNNYHDSKITCAACNPNLLSNVFMLTGLVLG